MKVISTIKKRAVLIIGVLAIATVSLVTLSSANYGAQSKYVNNTHQTLTSTSLSTGVSDTTHKSSAPQTLGTSASDESSSTLTESSTSSNSTQSLSVTTGNSNSVAPTETPTSTPPNDIIPRCMPCGPQRIDNTPTDALLCPEVNCVNIYPNPPVNPPTQPTPSCGCGINNQFSESNPHACMMIMCAY